MKKYLVCLLLSLGIIHSNQAMADQNDAPIENVIEKGLYTATSHALRMAKTLAPQKGKFPKTTKNGKLVTSDYSWWCSGFFPGELWYLYENYPSAELKKYAELFTEQVENAKNINYSHDLGFMLNCSFGNGYRLTQSLKVSHRTLLEYVRIGRLKAVKIGGKWTVTKENLSKFVNGEV